MRRSLRDRLFVFVFMLALMVLMQRSGAFAWLDVHLFGERVKDTVTSLFGGEDWARSGAVLGGDSVWLETLRRDPRIAHALGGSGTVDANSYVAFARSVSMGFRVLEVDVWLDEVGRPRCHHGPEPAPAYRSGDCLVTDLVVRAAAAGVWVLLDVKTDWNTTVAALLRQLPDPALARSMVVQIYRPEQLDRFNLLQQTYPLPMPLVTSYLSRRSLDHVVAGASARGIHAFAVPLNRLPALSALPSGVEVFVHPVHDCETLEALRRVDRRGVFTRSGLRCGSEELVR
jgi:hypothetical protein